MRYKIILAEIFFLMFLQKGFSQNVEIEIVDYLKSIDGVEYSTFQYANSSYSHSRPLLIFITDKDNFDKIYSKIPNFFLTKQEYTDVFVLGINKFDKNKITEIEKKIINEFLENIMKFRVCYDLPIYDKELMYTSLNYITKNDDLCKYLSCRNRSLKK
jgi:hypothetical protein